ncbi:NfeD family protein [Chloroflexota bacterium]
MKKTIKDWLIVLVLLLDEAAAVVLVFVVLWGLGIEIPLLVVIAVALALGAVIFITHKAIIPTFHKKKVTGADGLIGIAGEVIQPLTPVGVVMVGGEYWKAKSVGEDIAVGEEVEILGVNGLALTVRLKDRGPVVNKGV